MSGIQTRIPNQGFRIRTPENGIDVLPGVLTVGNIVDRHSRGDDKAISGFQLILLATYQVGSFSPENEGGRIRMVDPVPGTMTGLTNRFAALDHSQALIGMHFHVIIFQPASHARFLHSCVAKGTISYLPMNFNVFKCFCNKYTKNQHRHYNEIIRFSCYHKIIAEYAESRPER